MTGLDWAFAPTVAVVRDMRWGRSYESFGEIRHGRAYAAAMVHGLQGRLGRRVHGARSHPLGQAFPGRWRHPGPRPGRHAGPEACSSRVHGAAIARHHAGALTVMASYNSWQGVKMHADQDLLTDVLKGRLGFDGFVIGDWNAQEQIPGCTKSDCPAAVLAGVDMYMAPDSWKALYRNSWPRCARARSRRRGSTMQCAASCASRRWPACSTGPRRKRGRARALRRSWAAPSTARSPARRSRESLVLLKNERRPCRSIRMRAILVAGEAADDIGTAMRRLDPRLASDHNENSDFPAGTSIFAGIRAAVAAAGGTATLSREGITRHGPMPRSSCSAKGPMPNSRATARQSNSRTVPNPSWS